MGVPENCIQYIVVKCLTVPSEDKNMEKLFHRADVCTQKPASFVMEKDKR